ncbi:MAG: type IV secretion system DNA-binding domain-containing protein [Bdellovibrionales bacterium]|nr:type IV secretion system DNA-binding domain-containing protein [Bdellovibrionales bacterium]
MSNENSTLILIGAIVIGVILYNLYMSLSLPAGIVLIIFISVSTIIGLVYFWENHSKPGREKKKTLQKLKQLPKSLLLQSKDSVYMGEDKYLNAKIYLPDHIRSRHVHILGATGSGKTESVILNFLKQDVKRGLGSIILDAKGDNSFIDFLNSWVPLDRLKVFDLGSGQSLTYNPLEVGSPLEAAQRLFSSLVWSEEYYKSKALSTLQRLFERHHKLNGENPKLTDLNNYLDDPETFAASITSEKYPKKMAEKDFSELSGLRDQIRSLCIGHLESSLSPNGNSDMDFSQAKEGAVLYFRLQSLMSPQLVTILGRLIINQLNYLAGTAHRENKANEAKLIPTYLDEFASFACPEFADLISKARSAGMALHFSHQSIGDLAEVSKGFLNRITDNSATKIVLRINDPDSADFFARSFGTELYQKVTQRITNTEEIDLAEVVGEGSQREAHQFRASPDLLKTLPTGVGAVLIAHGEDTETGASSVFKVSFPRLQWSPMSP